MPDEGVGAVGSPGSRQGDDTGSTFQRAQTGDWRETLPQEIRGEKSFDVFKGKGWGEVGPSMAKSFLDGQKMIGSSFRLPAKDAKPEDRKKAVNDIIGKLRAGGDMESIPESPDKYEIKMPEMEGFKANEPLLNSFKEFAHKSGVPPSQAQGLFDWYLNFQEEADSQSQAEFETMKRGLKKEFGGLYTRKMEAARRAVAKYFGEDGDNIISQLPPAIGRKMVLAFSEIGDPMLEDSLMSGGILGVVTKDQVKAKIDAMMNDKTGPLMDISHGQHKEAVETYSNLQKQYIRLGGK